MPPPICLDTPLPCCYAWRGAPSNTWTNASAQNSAIEGIKALVTYAETTDKSVGGQVKSIELFK